MVTMQEVLVAFNAAVTYLGETDQLEKFVDSMVEHGASDAFAVLHVSEWMETMPADEWASLYVAGLQHAVEAWEAHHGDNEVEDEDDD